MDDKLQRILSRTTLYPEKIEKLPEFGIIKLPDHYEKVVRICFKIFYQEISFRFVKFLIVAIPVSFV